MNSLRLSFLEIEGRKSAKHFAKILPHFSPISYKNLARTSLWGIVGATKPMVCMRGIFHENDGNHENDDNDEDNSDSYKQGVECCIGRNHGNHGNDENHGIPECKPRVHQTTGLEIPRVST